MPLGNANLESMEKTHHLNSFLKYDRAQHVEVEEIISEVREHLDRAEPIFIYRNESKK